MKKLLCSFFIVYILSPSFAFGTSEKQNDNRPIIAVSFNAIHELVAAVAGDNVRIVSLIPDTADAHHYEPRRADLENLSKADMLFINGLGMEPWIENLVNKNLFPKEKCIDLSQGHTLIQLEDEHASHGHTHEGHEHGEYDPHIWLGLSDLAAMATKVADALSTIDPAHASYYKAHAQEFSNELAALQNEYREKFSEKKQKYIVVGHNAFAYLCRDFNLEQRSVKDTFNEGEASAKMLAELVNFCKENHIKVIFSEVMVSPEVSQTLARDAGAKLETLYTLEQAADNLSILERQKRNLEKIYRSLD